MLLHKLLQLMSLNLVKKKLYVGKMVFKHILKLAESNATKMTLGYPYLIFGILDDDEYILYSFYPNILVSIS